MQLEVKVEDILVRMLAIVPAESFDDDLYNEHIDALGKWWLLSSTVY